MVREVIELTITTKSGEVQQLCESFSITSTGYIAINYADGGHGCIYEASKLKRVRTVFLESNFKNMEDYLFWKHISHKDSYTVYDRRGNIVVEHYKNLIPSES